MEVHSYKSGAMCNSKISVTEVKCHQNWGLSCLAHVLASAESKVCYSSNIHTHGNVYLPHLQKLG